MSDQQRNENEDLIWKDLEKEHVARLKDFARRKRRAISRENNEDHDNHHNVFKVRQELRVEFYKQNGYKLYLDSQGREIWLPPDEYKWRASRRQRRRQSKMSLFDRLRPQPLASKVMAAWLGLTLLAIIIGAFLILL